MSERNADVNKTIDAQSDLVEKPKSIDSESPVIAKYGITKNAENVSKPKDESIDSVQQERQICDSARNVPVKDCIVQCWKCNKPMEPKKGYVRSDAVNAVTWVCRTCGTKAYTWTPDHGQDQGQAVHDKEPKSSPLGNDAFDSFFEIFGFYRVAKSGSKTLPKSGMPHSEMSHDADNDAQYTKSP